MKKQIIQAVILIFSIVLFTCIFTVYAEEQHTTVEMETIQQIYEPVTEETVKSSVKDFILSIDLREILYAAIGAFVGFWLAILLDKRSTRKNEEKLINVSLYNIFVELEDIYKGIEEAGNKEQLFLDVPIYEASIQSGNILLFVEKSYYGNLLKTYAEIKILAAMEKEKSSNRIQYRKEVTKSIQEVKEQIKADKVFTVYIKRKN